MFAWIKKIALGSFLLWAALISGTPGNDSVRVPPTSRTTTSSNSNSSPPYECILLSRATFLAVGDIMLSRGVRQSIDRSGDPNLPFTKLADEFQSTDFNFANLESPVSGDDSHVGKGLVFNTRTADLAGLVKNNFRIVSLANNHALDQGPDGLRSTRRYLSEIGIQYAGAGDGLDEAWRPVIMKANGISIAFIAASYSSVNDGGQARNEFVARTDDRENLVRAIRQAREESDFIVATMHAGVEYTRWPDEGQVSFARAAIDAGADMVIGSHPHWIQAVEQYKGKPIFYSLGNFVFDQRKPDTIEGLMLEIQVDREACGSKKGNRIVRLNRIMLVPVNIEEGGIPRAAAANEAATILRKIGLTDSYIYYK